MATYKKAYVFLIGIIIFLLVCIGFLLHHTLKQTECDSNYTSPEIIQIESALTQALSEAVSNADTIGIYDDYTAKMDELGKQYQDVLLKNCGEELSQKLNEHAVAWNVYEQNCISTQLACLQERFTTGSIVPVLLAQYQYKLHKQRTLELYRLCVNLMHIKEQ